MDGKCPAATPGNGRRPPPRHRDAKQAQRKASNLGSRQPRAKPKFLTIRAPRVRNLPFPTRLRHFPKRAGSTDSAPKSDIKFRVFPVDFRAGEPSHRQPRTETTLGPTPQQFALVVLCRITAPSKAVFAPEPPLQPVREAVPQTRRSIATQSALQPTTIKHYKSRRFPRTICNASQVIHNGRQLRTYGFPASNCGEKPPSNQGSPQAGHHLFQRRRTSVSLATGNFWGKSRV